LVGDQVYGISLSSFLPEEGLVGAPGLQPLLKRQEVLASLDCFFGELRGHVLREFGGQLAQLDHHRVTLVASELLKQIGECGYASIGRAQDVLVHVR
jgi:hypothetical protein